MTINPNNRNLRVGINGFGRIGRAVLRVLEQRGRHQVVHINDIFAANLEQVKYLTAFDSLYGRFPGEVKVNNGCLAIRSERGQDVQQISLSSLNSTLQVDWRGRGVEVVVEATGNAEAIANCHHLVDTGIQYIVITSNSDQADVTVAPGVYSGESLPNLGALTSAATCDVIAAGPLIHALLSLGSIEHIRIVTIHPWLNYQPLLDSPLAPQAGAINQGNFGLGRAATLSVIPKATSLEAALAHLFPALKDRIQTQSYRVPTPIVCYGDMYVELKFSTTREDVLKALAEKASVIGFTDDSFASVDFLGDNRAAILDLRWLRVDKNRVAIVYAYDNEWGYANSVVDILDRIANQMRGA